MVDFLNLYIYKTSNTNVININTILLLISEYFNFDVDKRISVVFVIFYQIYSINKKLEKMEFYWFTQRPKISPYIEGML